MYNCICCIMYVCSISPLFSIRICVYENAAFICALRVDFYPKNAGAAMLCVCVNCNKMAAAKQMASLMSVNSSVG